MRVVPGVDPSKVKVRGPGVGRSTAASEPAQFTVDARDAGLADLECVVQVRWALLLSVCVCVCMCE